MSAERLFADHLNHLLTEYASALQACDFADQPVLVGSGISHSYYADDLAIPFRAWGHFLRWLPVDRPDQFVLFRHGKKPVFFAVIPQDFWHDQSLELPGWWADLYDIRILPDKHQLEAQLKTLIPDHQLLFLGEDVNLAAALGARPGHVNPASLIAYLDYYRAYKTRYEVQRIADANALALTGHQAAHEAFLDGKDEFGIHMAYLTACRALDHELPYPSIVGVNEHAAILHYQLKKRRSAAVDPALNKALLIDAGCRSFAYCSDITRTWVRPGVHEVFAALLSGMQKLQRNIIRTIAVGQSYVQLHEATHESLAELLIESGIAVGSSRELLEEEVTSAFLPHGLGHFLGLQVHDCGGRLASPDGTTKQPPSRYPALRTTRTLENGMVFTIEPGLYFIPALLDKLRTGRRQALLNWTLIEELLPLGGIRIEDNIWLNEGTAHNLTLKPLLSA
ncbi:Xaa-Pro dipeptidase [Pseudohongiella spirulinae]|uniref:Xaa-Pro dipeptidase n=1 Tax=Pseudohongiella spirulinae TaxID=1249552 RepID=A0A0S2K9L7_9GAMM|nr:Xaa-Pro dipeptidase [Pseudohongiella spirulinae]ALO45021.1 proline dipeptidase [Pseudohongiella spirulinae]